MRPSRAWQGRVDRTRSGEAPQTNPVLLIYTPAASPGSTTDAVEKPTMGDDAEPEIDFSTICTIYTHPHIHKDICEYI